MSNEQQHPSSFKDPSGFVFEKDGLFYRQVNSVYAGNYRELMKSGLYSALIEKRYLLPHAEVHENFLGSPDWFTTILPEQLSFTSFFYEWCFDQLKDAALLTLSIQRIAIEHGMVLKDATPFNIQFHHGSPVFIDTLSFEKYDPAKPWIAYRQFCECFLFPLFLQKYLKIDAPALMLTWPNGIPAEVTKELLPWRSNFNLGVGLHVSLQSKIKGRKSAAGYKGAFDKKKMVRLISNLEENVKASSIKKGKTAWSNYYDETISSKKYLLEKEKVLRGFISEGSFETVLDIGSNDGFFSKIIAEKACHVVAIDFDSTCIENLYTFTRKQKIANILPLCIDIANPTPATGFNNTERPSFIERSRFDLAVALALVHHLAIARNIPFLNIAQYFSRMATRLIIEFIPKEDEKVQQLLEHRQDIFSGYNEASFEKAFEEFFEITSRTKIEGSLRTLYLLKSKVHD